jgi:hypothetical protein
MGNRKRQRYLSYLVFDQQKIRYYGVVDATYPLNDAELRLVRTLTHFFDQRRNPTKEEIANFLLL